MAVLAPAGTIAEAGTVRMALVLAIERAVPPLGALPVSVMVQAVPPFGGTVLGLHCRDEMVSTSERVRLADCEEAFSEAVMVTLWLDAMDVCEALPAAALAEKVAETAPAATVTEAGVLTEMALSLMATETPPEGAAFEMVTVQVVLEFAVRLVAAH